MTATKEYVQLNSAIVGIGEKDDVLDVERTDFLQAIIDNGHARVVTRDEVEGAVVYTEVAADRQAPAPVIPGDGEDAPAQEKPVDPPPDTPLTGAPFPTPDKQPDAKPAKSTSRTRR